MEESQSEPQVTTEEDIESLQKTLEEEKAKAEKYLANWQRAEADFSNYKKRAEQEREETVKFANVALIRSVLPVLDDLERALASLPPKIAGLTWADGIKLIYRKLQASLEAQGLSEIKALGEAFDPAVHEAVAQGEGEEGKIVEELQRGYKLGNRLVRPAMVVVGKGEPAKKEEK